MVAERVGQSPARAMGCNGVERLGRAKARARRKPRGAITVLRIAPGARRGIRANVTGAIGAVLGEIGSERRGGGGDEHGGDRQTRAPNGRPGSAAISAAVATIKIAMSTIAIQSMIFSRRVVRCCELIRVHPSRRR